MTAVSWISRFFTSSIGKKVIMSLTGLFLITFLAVHLAGNLQLLAGPTDGVEIGQAFNEYAYFMTSNPLIKFTSYGLYAFILLHAIQGILLWRQNMKARGSVRYAVKNDRVASATKSSIWMGSLGTVILIFIIVHMVQFWAQMKFTDGVDEVVYAGADYPVRDLYKLVAGAFSNILFVIFYVVSMVFIAFHLAHGFESAFQTLGLNHPKWSPIIKTVGRAYAILVPLGFAIIPIYMYFNQG